MTIHFREYLDKIVSNAITFASNARNSIKNGTATREIMQWMKANWPFALLSLIIASVFYFICRSNISYFGSRSIPVVLSVDDDKYITHLAPSPAMVKVEVSGTVADVRKFESNTDPIKIKVTADEFKAHGEHLEVWLKRKDIPELRGLALKCDIKPNRINIEGDSIAAEEFYLNLPKIEGKPYLGDPGEITIEPTSITASGGKKTLQALKAEHLRLDIEAVNVEGIKDHLKTVSTVVKPEIFKKNGISIISDPQIRVTVEYKSHKGMRVFEKLPVRISLPTECTLPGGWKIEPHYVTAKLTGFDTSMESLSSPQITAYAEVAAGTKFIPGTTITLPIKLEVPHDKEIWDVKSEPANVKLIIPAQVFPDHAPLPQPIEKAKQ